MPGPRFFVDKPLTTGTSIELPSNAAHHLIRVLRAQPGGEITLFNGRGGEFHCILTEVKRGNARAEVHSFDAVERESPLSTHLGIAVIKRQAMDAALVRACELGVTSVTPLITERVSVSRRQLREEHWRGVLVSSCEQCGRNRLPELHETQLLSEWLGSDHTGLRVVAHPGASGSFDGLPGEAEAVVFLVGPEGGLTDGERDLAVGRGFVQIGLGPRTLRAETMPSVLLALAQSRWGDVH